MTQLGLAQPSPAAAGEAAPAVQTAELGCRFGQVQAVDAVDLAISPGAICGLVGPDGAGKSTLIRMLATVQRPSAGDATVFGESVVTAPHKVTPRLGYMSQRFSMYPDLTVAENIDFFATIRGVPKAERGPRAAALLEGMGLAEFAGRQAQNLSGGMKQKLMLAATLMSEPDLLLLDEPTTGVDPVSRREFWRILAELHRAGKTVLVATPYMDEAERCTQVAFMEGGRIRHQGTPAAIKALVPGVLLEVSSPTPRQALALLAAAPQTMGSHLYGDVVRVIWDGADPMEPVAGVLRAGGVAGTARSVPVDMETAFAYLADTASAAHRPGDEGDGVR